MSGYIAGKRFKLNGEMIEPGSVVEVENEQQLGALVRGGFLISREEWDRPIFARRKLRIDGVLYNSGDALPSAVRTAQSFETMIRMRWILVGKGIPPKPRAVAREERESEPVVKTRPVKTRKPVAKPKKKGRAA